MATVTPPRSRSSRADSDRRVRHPLQSLRGYIRLYVTLEGAAIALIYLALWFWIGLLLDYGSFKVFRGFDWIQELQGITPEGQATDVVVRTVILGLLVAGLLAVVTLKILLRLFREFRDTALALVLERRFPRELGDRLITAVEMADPKLAARYGFSQAMVEKTINDAADRVERVPVRGVFNWRRLWGLGLIGAGLTLGLYLLWGIGYLGANAVAGSSTSAGDYLYRFHHVASIWTERNILLMDSYWPRQAYLDLVRFQDTRKHPGVMRIGRDEQRPDLQVRAYEWVIADDEVPGGWRPLLWADVPDLIGQDLPARVNVPADWRGWIIDLEDLDPSIPNGVLPGAWQGLTSGAIRAELARPQIRQAIATAGALPAVEELLNWQTWSVDKIAQQEQNGDVRRALRADHPQALLALENVLEQVKELAQSAAMERTVRQLEIPAEDDVLIHFWGKNTRKSSGPDRSKDNNFFFGLNDLKESVQFSVRAADFTTPARHIQLVPPPSLTSLTVDKEEPAYIYYRLQGDQAPLKGKRQIFTNVPVSITGEASIIQVPIGTNLSLTAQVDREVKDGVRMRRPAVTEERGAILPHTNVQLQDDHQTFVTQFPNVVKTIEFDFEFNDLDNVKGKRRILIRPIDDRAPEVFDVEMSAILRKPRFKAEPGKSSQGTAADGFLITPDALIPFKGTLRDDYGLTDANWNYEVEPVEIELVGQPLGKDKLPSLVLQGNTRIRRAGLVVSGFRFMPGTPGLEIPAPLYSVWLTRMVGFDLAYSAKRLSDEGARPLERFLMRLGEREPDELTLNDLLQRLTKKPPERGLFKEHSLKDEEGFDFKRFLPKLKVQDPTKEAQLHYQVRLSITATDNNVETGPSTGRNKAPFTYLVVSENELLSQIFLEEETLRERLEKVVFKLKNARTSMSEQIGKLSSTAADLGLVGIRIDEVRKAVSDTGSTTREVHGDYNRILRELEVNRVGWDKGKKKINDVLTKIVQPLEEIVNSNFGNFFVTEEAVANLYKGVDEDVAVLRQAEDDKALEELKQKVEPNRPGHLKNAQLVRDRLESLIDRLNAVLLAMDEGIITSKLLEMIIIIERDHRQAAERLQRFYQGVVDEFYKDLLKDKLN